LDFLGEQLLAELVDEAFAVGEAQVAGPVVHAPGAEYRSGIGLALFPEERLGGDRLPDHEDRPLGDAVLQLGLGDAEPSASAVCYGRWPPSCSRGTNFVGPE